MRWQQGEHNEIISIDTYIRLYSIGDLRTNLFEKGENDRIPRVSTLVKLADYGGFELPSQYQAHKYEDKGYLAQIEVEEAVLINV